jgi:ABC-type branched-subunit amino acid transport system substrate-binding protein
MRRPIYRLVALPLVLTLLAAACGKSRDATAPTSPSVTAAPSTSGGAGDTSPATQPAPALPSFGDAPWPCGKGTGANTDSGSEPGVTKDSVSIATGDDAGYVGSPGLNHEITDAMKALVAKCNELGGINGRKIVMNYFDAKIFEVVAAVQAACDQKDFFLVGEGWAFDGTQEETRLKCGLPAVPTYSVSGAFAHGKDVYVGVPNPSDEMSAGFFEQIGKLFPDAVKHVATLVAGFSATQESRDKMLAVSPQFGWSFTGAKLEYNPVGEADWTPFVKQIKDAGATMIYWSGTCLPHLQLFAQTAKANGLDVPIMTDANHYATSCSGANTDGALNNMYLRMTSIPLEEADTNKATQDYLDLMKQYGGDVALLGTQTASSFLLWATAASNCGAELTRACTLANLAKTTKWTGHGLHSEDNPGQNHPSSCDIVLKLDGTVYKRVAPTERGTYECKDSWIAKVTSTPALTAALLDANRISQQFAAK